jgi:hypothetical protein
LKKKKQKTNNEELLDSPQHKRCEHLVQAENDQRFLLVRHFRLFFPERRFKPLIEIGIARENFGHQIIEQSPQILQRVLQRSSCQQKLAKTNKFPKGLEKITEEKKKRQETRKKHLCNLTCIVVDVMSFVDDNHMPFHLAQMRQFSPFLNCFPSLMIADKVVSRHNDFCRLDLDETDQQNNTKPYF